VVQEESIDEHMVEERQRNGRARAKYRFGRDRQATDGVYKTNDPFLDWRSAVGDEAKASSLNAAASFRCSFEWIDSPFLYPFRRERRSRVELSFIS
jgi:hypothetical protein